MSLNPFAVTDLRPEVELMHLLRTRRHYCHVWNRQHCTDSEFAWTLSCFTCAESHPNCLEVTLQRGRLARGAKSTSTYAPPNAYNARLPAGNFPVWLYYSFIHLFILFQTT